jgi:pimeloyl-ACP methyl ester carboxylesterase
LTLADVWLPTLQPNPFGLDRDRWLKVRAQLSRAGHDVDHDLPRVAHGFLEEFMERDQTGDVHGGSIEAFSAMGQRQSPVVRRWMQLVRTTSAAGEFSDGAGISVEDIKTIWHPASIAFGARSRYLSTMRGLRRALSNHRCAIIPNAGHFFPIFHPNVIVQMIMQSVSGDAATNDQRYASAILTRAENEPESESAQERR